MSKRTATADRPAQYDGNVGKKLGPHYYIKQSRKEEGQSSTKVRIKWIIHSTLKFVPFYNSQRFEVCGVFLLFTFFSSERNIVTKSATF